jgi:hypothetical protein
MAPAEFAVWHKLVPVTVANGEEVAVAEPWSFPDIFEGVTTAHMLASGPRRRTTNTGWTSGRRIGLATRLSRL